jgi:hypothetical protein
MIGLNIHIRLDSDDRRYLPGESLTGRFSIDGPEHDTVRAAEFSVLWYTTGKGEEDLAVHFFERFSHERISQLDFRTPHPFEIHLPFSPQSYDGMIVKVCWCARLRLFLPRGQEVVSEEPFRLGEVQPTLMN